ncbi:hypothetical protein ACFL09_02315, partial [Planctomycetota bacterium]
MPIADSDTAPSLPLGVLVLLAVWAVAVLAYPAWFLVTLLRSESLGVFVQAMPFVIVLGVTKLPVILIALAIWLIAIGAGMFLLRRTGFDTLTTGERAVFGGALGMGILSLGTFLLGKLSSGPTLLLSALLALLLVAMAALGFRDIARAAIAARDWFREW